MLALGEVLGGRYRLGAAIGQGATAEVHVADDVLTGERVAVKLLRTDETTLRWSTREAAALRRLNHPAIVRLRAAGTHAGQPFLVLDFIDGRPLSALLATGPLPAEWAADLMAAVADGLAHAHALGVTHRDVKPSNILVDAAGRPYLADFGVARLTEVTTATAAGSLPRARAGAAAAPAEAWAPRCHRRGGGGQRHRPGRRPGLRRHARQRVESPARSGRDERRPDDHRRPAGHDVAHDASAHHGAGAIDSAAASGPDDGQAQGQQQEEGPRLVDCHPPWSLLEQSAPPGCSDVTSVPPRHLRCIRIGGRRAGPPHWPRCVAFGFGVRSGG
jgi:tRNA A-37 threonylcarbamoyl transferase component Bud32